MKILLTGATGLIGRPLARALGVAGHDLVFLGRDPIRANQSLGLPGTYLAWDDTLPGGIEAVIHLAGESVSGGRWTAEFKSKLVESRIRTTRQLVDAFAQGTAPKVWINASAVGYYGDRGDEALNEQSAPGQGFLSFLCQDWESESRRIQEQGSRWIALRLGVVLARTGGALSKLGPLFSTGLGGPIAGGRHWMSWIHLDDVVRLIEFALVHPELQGPVNAVAPLAVQNREFSQTLARVLHRPSVVPTPRLAIEAALGEQSSIVLDSQRVAPEKALSAGFEFKFPTLERALQAVYDGPLGSEVFEATQWIAQPVEKVVEFFSNAQNLEALTPPWLLQGPYTQWEHTHTFTPLAGGTLIEDRVVYRLPVSPISSLLAGRWVASDVRRIFEFRWNAIREKLQ